MIEIVNILEVEKYIDEVDVVIFDLDDTLYSEKDYVKSGYKKIADYFEVQQMASDMWSVFENGGKAIDEVLEKYNLLEKKDEALHIYRYQRPEIHLYPGVAEMIDRIRDTKKVCIITDGRPEGQRAKLEALDIVVDNVIITDELGGVEWRKPNPTAFQLTKEYLGVKFERMVYVGDNMQKDFIAPKKLGMNCIWFKNPEGLYSSLYEKKQN